MIIIHTEHICVKHTRFAHTCRNMFTHTDTVSDVSLSLSFSLLFTVSCGFSSWQQMRRVTWPENSQHLIGSWQTFKLLLVSLISSGRDLRSLYWEKELHTWKNEIHDCKITSHTHTHTHLKKGVLSDVSLMFVCFWFLMIVRFIYSPSDLNESVHLCFSLSPGEYFLALWIFVGHKLSFPLHIPTVI